MYSVHCSVHCFTLHLLKDSNNSNICLVLQNNQQSSSWSITLLYIRTRSHYVRVTVRITAFLVEVSAVWV